MKRRGRKRAVPLHKQKEIFVKFEKFFRRKDELPSPCDPVFKDISQELSFKMSEKSLYLSLIRN